MPRTFTATAIIAAHNEADIIAPVIEHLIQQGLSVYLLDHASTDGTAQAAEPFIGRGLLAIEPFPSDRFPDARRSFAWADILMRKAELATTLDADWVIHHDADEFRESPWTHLSLLEAIERVDRLGFNAIDFALFNFWPTDDSFRAGEDPRSSFRFYEPGQMWDKTQVKCWKRAAAAGASGAGVPDLATSGGHDVMFAGRRVFPLRFVLRHYPIRSQAHGERKVFVERLPRYRDEEVARGWHVQYDDYAQGMRFTRDSDTLVEYDGEAVRAGLVVTSRDADDRDAHLAEADRLRDELTRVSGELARRLTEIQALGAERAAEVQRLKRDVYPLHDRLLSDIVALRRDADALRTSRSWRWTAPFRAVMRLLGR